MARYEMLGCERSAALTHLTFTPTKLALKRIFGGRMSVEGGNYIYNRIKVKEG